MENSSLATQLKEMGFTDDQIAVATKHSSDKSLEGVIGWLETHPNIEEFVAKDSASGGDTEKMVGENSGEKKDEGEMQPEEVEGKPISDMVNKEFAAGLEGMGYSKNVREKALLMSGNASIEAALEWIEQHKEDPDFEEEMKIVAEKPKLSKEEALQRAKELQQRIREENKRKEAEMEFEREKARIAGGKALTEAKRKMEEQEKKRAVEQRMKEKKEDEEYMKKLQEELERERIARFGKEHAKPSTAQQGETPADKIKFAIKNMRKAYPITTNPETCVVCFQTIHKIISNIAKDPNEVKFQKINLENPNFKARCGDVIGGVFILKTCGFDEDGTFLVLKNKLLNDYPKILELLQTEIDLIKSC